MILREQKINHLFFGVSGIGKAPQKRFTLLYKRKMDLPILSVTLRIF